MIHLSSIDAKLRRAQTHRDELEKLVASARDDVRLPLLNATLDPDTGFHVFAIAAVPPLADLIEDISVATADMVHNLRSALDHLGWQLACRYRMPVTVAERRQISFPLCPKMSTNRPIVHRQPAFLDPVDWAVLHEYQPCRGINGRSDSWSGDYVHQLELLHRLWNQDKHIALPIVVATSNEISTVPTRAGHPPWIVLSETGIDFDPTKISEPDPLADEADFTHSSFRVEEGAEVVRVRMTSRWAGLPYIELAGFVYPRFNLDDAGPLLPALDRLSSFVKQIVDQWR